MQGTRSTIQSDERGFTLVETMVVVLVIAILIAIAIPVFLGQRTRSEDRVAHTNLRLGFTVAKAHFADRDTYTDFDAAEGASMEPSLSWSDGPGVAEGRVTVRKAEDRQVVLTTLSASGQAYCLGEDVDGVHVGKGNPSKPSSCSGGW